MRAGVGVRGAGDVARVDPDPGRDGGIETDRPMDSNIRLHVTVKSVKSCHM